MGKCLIAATGTAVFVHIPNPQAYSLRPNKGVVAGTENIYMLSVHHQLHCLRQLHLSFIALRVGSRFERHGDAAQELKHAEHCFDYLRQAIICSRDSTLEGPDMGKSSLTGNGVVHRCRAWDEPGGLEAWSQSHAP